MEINNNNSISRTQSQLRLAAHKARAENKKVLNESLKSLNEDVKPISSTDALKYLQSKSNISKADNSYYTGDNYNSNLSKLSSKLKAIKQDIANYNSGASSNEEKAKETELSDISFDSLDVKLEETDYNPNTFNRTYTSQTEKINLGNYSISDFQLKVKLNDENKAILDGTAQTELNSTTYELSLAQTLEGENVFLFDEEAKIEINDNIYLNKFILAQSSLNYTANTSRNEEIETNDKQIIEVLKSLESNSSSYTSGATDSIIANSKDNKTTLLGEFKNLLEQNEDNENFKQDLLQLRIDSIQSQDRATRDSTTILLNIL